ncbi:hypothetical protein [Bradyrhizobium sp. STM 3809]|uniref:lipase/acyltransferase domain-containing protein n=1 Tax=Bradyrhizobium sp. STM 3809 TaxID=551936 RepID=UPI0002408DA0|nr:hypothetical protein [Bradyrhizobium sp. STM 3809]CCE00528.1 conserved hypothetical protein [Bradyrhizobium sp. STM 3809]
MNDVVVLIPGIMGSAIEKNGVPIWDASLAAGGRLLWTLGKSLDALALSSDSDTGADAKATRLMPDVHMIPFFWKIDGYSALSKYIQSTLNLTMGEDYFEFAYDWRLDNRISARRLQQAASGWLEQRRKQYPDARLVVVGHSMGGLVARYFIEVLGGWRDTRRLITLGTPHRGSVKALDALCNGLQKHIGSVTLLNLSSLIETFPSAYQLLPIYPCVGKTADRLEPLEQITQKMIGRLDLDRARHGVEFHREIERAVKKNQEDAAYGYRILPVVGTEQPTLLSAVLTDQGVQSLRTYKGKTMLGGDGTVPRVSATPIELSNRGLEMFAACPHASLQNFDPVRTQMKSVVNDIDISQMKAVAAAEVSLDLPDAIGVTEALIARARCPGSLDPIRANIRSLDTNLVREAEFADESDGSGWEILRVPNLDAGTYRIRVDAGPGSEPIEDLFAVVE